MLENYEEDVRIRPKSKADDLKSHKRHIERDNERDRYSPSQPSRHSSLSFNSNFENDQLDFSKRKSNSRLSFADEINDDRHYTRRKSTSNNNNNSNLKLMLNNELSRARSSESLRSSKRDSKFFDSDNEKTDRRYRKDYHEESDRHKNIVKERSRERSKSIPELEEQDEKRREKGIYF